MRTLRLRLCGIRFVFLWRFWSDGVFCLSLHLNLISAEKYTTLPTSLHPKNYPRGVNCFRFGAFLCRRNASSPTSSTPRRYDCDARDARNTITTNRSQSYKGPQKRNYQTPSKQVPYGFNRAQIHRYTLDHLEIWLYTPSVISGMVYMITYARWVGSL